MILFEMSGVCVEFDRKRVATGVGNLHKLFVVVVSIVEYVAIFVGIIRH